MTATKMKRSEVGISKIPRSQAVLMANRTVAIPGDEGNYVVALNVFHQLHCLVRSCYSSLSDKFGLAEQVDRTSYEKPYIQSIMVQ